MGNRFLQEHHAGKESCFCDCLGVSEYIKGLLLPHLHTLNICPTQAMMSSPSPFFGCVHAPILWSRITVLKHVQLKNMVAFNRLVKEIFWISPRLGCTCTCIHDCLGVTEYIQSPFPTCIHLTCPRSMQSKMSSTPPYIHACSRCSFFLRDRRIWKWNAGALLALWCYSTNH